MRNVIRTTTSIAVLLMATAALADEHAAEGAGIFPPNEIKWQDGPKSLPAGAKIAVLEGDPNKEGPFVMRLRFPDGYKIPAHTHPKTERVTVISGTLNLVMGEKLDRKQARKVPAGSFGYWAAGMKHYAWFDGETVLQLHGMGPWTINYLNPSDDPRNKGK
jgi:quercetin dioxygenase-like cupin family protein